MNQKELITMEGKEYEALLENCEQLRLEIQKLKLHETTKPKKRWILQRPMVFLIIILMVGVMGTGAWGRMVTFWGYYSGNTYKKSIDQIQLAYVAGVSDGLSYASAMNDMKELTAFNNFVHEKPALEVKRIADRYLRSHPEDRANPMANIIFEAVMTHFKELN